MEKLEKQKSKILKKESSALSLKKSRFGYVNKKNKHKKRFSAEFIEKLEDINDYVGKSLSPLLKDSKLKMSKEHIPEIESASKVFVNNDGKKRKRRVASHFIAMSMKGYYSDSELDEIMKVDVEK